MIDSRVSCGGSPRSENSRIDKRLVVLDSYVTRLGDFWDLIIMEHNPRAFIRWESGSEIFDEGIIGSTWRSMEDLR